MTFDDIAKVSTSVGKLYNDLKKIMRSFNVCDKWALMAMFRDNQGSKGCRGIMNTQNPH